jgi:hypothetical protein
LPRRDLHDGYNRVNQRAALPAFVLRQCDAQQPLLRYHPRGIEGETRIVGALKRVLGEMLAREAAHLLGKLLLFIGEIEIHLAFQLFFGQSRSQRARTRS